ncbi:776_t:CDS:2 [Gigaspora margarita]|uniref:776_t:CDS:1 n=1 Tax=Gigaspora margarita TaxID=4874 RepID=A0ABM8W4G2_GIGMA|nr:776_t:CDS:2 [Gigaspora margarita]
MQNSYKFKNATPKSIGQWIDKPKKERPKRNNDLTTSKYRFVFLQFGNTSQPSVQMTPNNNQPSTTKEPQLQAVGQEDQDQLFVEFDS